MRSSLFRRGLTAVSVAACLGLAAPVASADELDDLISQMDQLSQEASAQNEVVKDLEAQIEQAAAEANGLKDEAVAATKAADKAMAAQQQAREAVNRVADTRYRGTAANQAIRVLGSDNPQSALDRSAYLSTLARNARDAVHELEKTTAAADKQRDVAARARAEADYRRNDLDSKLKQLQQQQDELQRRVDELTERIDGLNAEERSRWESKNNPIAPILDPAAASGAVGAALSKLGAPYSWGAAGPSEFDCSGLMYWAYQQQGKSIPRTSQAQVSGGSPVSKSELQPGDIVGFYPGVTHVGMYIGDGQVVHASDYGIPVQVVPVDSMPFAGAARY